MRSLAQNSCQRAENRPICSNFSIALRPANDTLGFRPWRMSAGHVLPLAGSVFLVILPLSGPAPPLQGTQEALGHVLKRDRNQVVWLALLPQRSESYVLSVGSLTVSTSSPETAS
jgi:hypothetical protein